MPPLLLELWRAVSGYAHPPEACLVNFYSGTAKMGLHQDRDEQALDAPVMSISLGDTALFRMGGTDRGGKTQSVKLASGDVLVIGGAARLCFHGIDRIYPGTSTFAEGWRAHQSHLAAGDKAGLNGCNDGVTDAVLFASLMFFLLPCQCGPMAHCPSSSPPMMRHG